MGRLSTHVLDTALGRPADGVMISLYRLTGPERRKLCQTQTNADGRTDAPLLQDETREVGIYELVFAVGAYLRKAGQVGDGTLFLDEVPIRFGVADAGQNYHVPLLLSPYGYSTYRGS